MQLRIILPNVRSERHLSPNSCDPLVEDCPGVLSPLCSWDEPDPRLSGPPRLKRKKGEQQKSSDAFEMGFLRWENVSIIELSTSGV